MSAFTDSGHSDGQNTAVLRVRFRPTAAIRSLAIKHIDVDSEKEPSIVRTDPCLGEGSLRNGPLFVGPEVDFLDESAGKRFISPNRDFQDRLAPLDNTPTIIEPAPNTFNPLTLMVDDFASGGPATEVLGQDLSVFIGTATIWCRTFRKSMH